MEIDPKGTLFLCLAEVYVLILAILVLSVFENAADAGRTREERSAARTTPRIIKFFINNAPFMVAGDGFEPPVSDSEPDVLPLH